MGALDDPAKKTEDREAISFDGPMDSVYLGAPEHVQLDVGTGALTTYPLSSGDHWLFVLKFTLI